MRQSAKLIRITPRCDELIEQAARICYKSKRNSEQERIKLIQKLIERGHESVLEHASATFHIVTDRGISHELVRHRLASFSQESTRYIRYNKIQYIDNIASKKVLAAIGKDYKKMLDSGARPGDARCILPNCLKTELIMTANFREWRHVIKLRTASGAHPMIRELAFDIQRQLRERSVCFVY